MFVNEEKLEQSIKLYLFGLKNIKIKSQTVSI